MNIQKYEAYFHDGALIDIEHSKDYIILSIESAEMEQAELKDPVKLSEWGTIKGKLHLKGVRSIYINETPFAGLLNKQYDKGCVVDLQIKKKKVKLAISWVNFPPKLKVKAFSTIEIEAEKVWWENIPDLYDPFW